MTVGDSGVAEKGRWAIALMCATSSARSDEVIVVLDAPTAMSVAAGGARRPETEELIELLRIAGLRLEPLHPDTDDSSLRCYFTVASSSGQDAERLAARIRSWPGVEAAYAKPLGEAP